MPAVKGAEIRARRQRTGMKLGEFARHAGVGYQTLANIECGHQWTVSMEVIYRIAAGLGMKPDDAGQLLADTGPEAGSAPAPKGVAA
jgi:transcriptional regulator with XRE-family HTH domain